MKKSFWNMKRSYILRKIIIIVYTVVLVLVDLRGYWILRHFLEMSPAYYFGEFALEAILGYLYVCSVPAYLVLFELFGLLSRLTKGDTFTRTNIKCLRKVSWCCLAVSAFTLPFISIWLLLSLVALAAGLAGLILRIVKNVFEQAVEMKDELDFTV